MPYGGGTWGSRGAGIAGEATVQAGKGLREYPFAFTNGVQGFGGALSEEFLYNEAIHPLLGSGQAT